MNNRKPGRPFGTFKGAYPAVSRGKITRPYRKWAGMIQRCHNPKHPNFKYYGGRGITVCERWRGRNGFSNFIIDLGVPPDGLTLDRIDNNKGYEPGNCRWATMKVQASNKRKRTPDPNSLGTKARLAGLSYHLVYFRIKKFGWSEERALSTPILPRGRQVGWRGEYKPRQTQVEPAPKPGPRLKRGWSAYGIPPTL